MKTCRQYPVYRANTDVRALLEHVSTGPKVIKMHDDTGSDQAECHLVDDLPASERPNSSSDQLCVRCASSFRISESLA